MQFFFQHHTYQQENVILETIQKQYEAKSNETLCQKKSPSLTNIS